MVMAPVASTETVLERHLQCFMSRDLEGILADYSPDAILFTQAGLVRGKEALATAFKGFFAEFAKPTSHLDLHVRSVEGEYAYIVWSAETADNVYELATDTFVIRDGRIVAQTFAAKTTPRG